MGDDARDRPRDADQHLQLSALPVARRMLPGWDNSFASKMARSHPRAFVHVPQPKTRIEKATLGNEAGLYRGGVSAFRSRRDDRICTG